MPLGAFLLSVPRTFDGDCRSRLFLIRFVWKKVGYIAISSKTDTSFHSRVFNLQYIIVLDIGICFLRQICFAKNSHFTDFEMECLVP